MREIILRPGEGFSFTGYWPRDTVVTLVNDSGNPRWPEPWEPWLSVLFVLACLALLYAWTFTL